jgi:hypothetical protein
VVVLQVIFKSMKLITTLVGSWLWLGNKHKFGEFVAAALLVGSAILFTLGDVGVSSPSTSAAAPAAVAAGAIALDATAAVGSAATAGAAAAATEAGALAPAAVLEAVPWFGICIVLLSLVFDSLHSNSQERVLKQLEAGPLETMFYTNLFSAALLFVWVVGNGELVPAVQYCAQYPMAYPYWILRASVIYFGVKCFLSLIKTNGNVLATSGQPSPLSSALHLPRPACLCWLLRLRADS